MTSTTSGDTSAAQHDANDNAHSPQRTRRWPGLPALLAYSAGATFTLAASATNLSYGMSKGTGPIEQAINGGVAVACSVALAAGMPAFAKAVASRSVAHAAMIACAVMVFGSYSVAGALGSAAGARTQQAQTERQAASDRERWQSSYERASGELARLSGPLPSAALATQIAALKATPGANACAFQNGPVSRDVCGKVEALEAEGRAMDREHRERRATLEREMRSASEALANAKAVRPANSDAKALAEFLGVLGVTATPEVIARVLVLLQVLLLECGGGLAFIVGAVLAGGPVERRKIANTSVEQPNTEAPKAPAPFTASEPAPFSVQGSEQLTAADHATSPETRAFSGVRGGEHSEPSTARDRLLAFVREQGGSVQSGQRAIAAAVGVSTGRLNALIGELRGEGKLQVRAGSTGTTLAVA